MKKVIPLVFVLVAVVLAFFVFSKNLFSEGAAVSHSKVVVPTSGDSKSDVELSESAAGTSFISLLNEETLISTVESDIDDDGFEDQVNIIKSASVPALQIVVALFSSASSKYERSYTIQTEISQVRTFVCAALDVVGNHKNALVYQGIADDGKSVMKIYSAVKGSGSDSEFKMDLIGDFSAEGTIFIQQNPRSEGYEMSQSSGESFPVWVYTSESHSTSNSTRLDQIQTMYDWSPSEKKYVESKSIHVAGSSIAAKELAKIQDGTVSSFSKFLDGLWYKNDNSKERRYIFFDYQNEEIVFYYQDSEEVYSWLKSNLRRNGIYFSSVNKSIENLLRKFDISLVSLDEIRVLIHDDVRMLIGEENLWDGAYKKVVTTKKSEPNRERVSEYVEKLVKEEKWASADGSVIDFGNGTYSIEKDGVSDKGRYTQIDIFGKTFIQFR
ncbi:MAG: pallilysin-related adhesin, partial [Treponema sp.]|nr:pallilysin-related adhesin [Treponema sp.]